VTITPRNGFLLVEPCDNPFEQGKLLVQRENLPMQWGRVVAAGSGDNEYRRAFTAGDIVFYEDRVGTPLVVDNNQINMLVNETVVMAFIPAEEAKSLNSIAVRVPSSSDIVVAQPNTLLN
jgi:co-chaperonin GroES (HSP10)